MNKIKITKEDFLQDSFKKIYDSVKASHRSSSSLMSYSGFNKNKKYHDIIKECIDVYYTTGIIRNIIDLMTDFASEGLKVEHKDAEISSFYNEWIEFVDFYSLVLEIFFVTILTGNCVIYRREGVISDTLIEKFSKIYKNNKIRSNKIPVGYSILNPTRISFEKSDLFNKTIVQFNLSDTDIEKIKNPRTDEEKKIVRSLSRKFKEEAIKHKYVTLDNSRLSIIQYKKPPWESWAIPLIFSAIDDINFKKTLRQMDESSAADVIKSVIIFKLGNTKEGLPPTKQRFQKLASLLKSPGEAKTIVWDDLIDVIDTYPPISKILGPEKYEVVDRDILSNFGISPVLINGGGGSYSNSFLSVRTLQEKLETVRALVLNKFVKKELNFIKNNLGFTENPAVKFSSMSLRDEQAEKKLLIQLADRKIISVASVQEGFNFDPEVENNRIKHEKEKGIETLSPVQPAQRTENPNVGRPDGINTPHEKERDTKPQGISVGKAATTRDIIKYFISINYPLLSDKESKLMTELALKSLGYKINEINKKVLLKSISNSVKNMTIEDAKKIIKILEE